MTPLRAIIFQLRTLLVLVCAALLLARPAAAQTVRGIVVDEAGAPVSGVILQLVDSSSKSSARTLSTQLGEFRLVAPRPGTYRITTMRIGFRPTTSDSMRLVGGAEITKRLTLTGVRVALDAMRIEDRSVCRSFTDSAAATFAVWEQVRAALTATDVTARSRAISATVVAYDRVLDPNNNRVRSQQSSVRTAFVAQPWSALSPDSLRRFGYIVEQPDQSVMYYAPGLDMLLSPVFIEDHCFRLKNDRARIGITFEPIPDRKDLRDIRGTIWLDKASSELRSLEFKFTGIPSEQSDAAGGAMTFVRMHDGAWVIGRWSLAMPVMQQRIRSQAFGGSDLHVLQIQSTGGELVLARRGSDTLWSSPPLVLKGTVRDSISGSAIAGARVSLVGTALTATSNDRGDFAVSGLLPGEYAVETRTPSLDSVGAAHRSTVTFMDEKTRLDLRVPTGAQIQSALCGKTSRDEPGIVVGSVHIGNDLAPPKNVKVSVEWDEFNVSTAGGTVDAARHTRELDTQTDARGMFRICGLPVNTAIRVHAENDEGVAPSTNVRLSEGARVASIDLMLDATVARVATLTGVVVDSTGKPMFAAEVAIPDVAKSTVTDARGGFKIADIPPGAHRVVARRVGYGALDTELSFSPNQTIDRRIVLSHVVALDSVVTTAAAIDPLMKDFAENKKIGLGHFVTRDDLAKLGQVRMSSALATVSGLRMLPGVHGQSFPSAARSPACAPQDGYCAQKNAGILYDGMHCAALVYWNDQLLNPNHPAEPIDVNMLNIDEVEAVEFYSSAGEVPARYNKLGSNCGVLVLHTRHTSSPPTE